MSFYESKGWMVGKNQMRDWKKALSGWWIRDGRMMLRGEAADSRSATLNAEAPHFGSDPSWPEYQRLVLSKKIGPGFVAWKEEADGDV